MDQYKEQLLGMLEHAKAAAGQLVDAAARKVINMGARILAVSSVYSQQNASLADAGFYCVQPGIESINDHLLALMGKGSSAVQNIKNLLRRLSSMLSFC